MIFIEPRCCPHCGKGIPQDSKSGHCQVHRHVSNRMPEHLREPFRALRREGYSFESIRAHLLYGRPLVKEKVRTRKHRPVHPREKASQSLGLRIVDEVSQATKVHRRDILGDFRFDFTVDARATVAQVMHRHGIGPSAIGRVLNRDHSTVYNLLRKFDERAAANPMLRALADRLTAQVAA